MGDRLRRIPTRTRTRSGACMLDTYMRTAPTLILLDGQDRRKIRGPP